MEDNSVILDLWEAVKPYISHSDRTEAAFAVVKVLDEHNVLDEFQASSFDRYMGKAFKEIAGEHYDSH